MNTKLISLATKKLKNNKFHTKTIHFWKEGKNICVQFKFYASKFVTRSHGTSWRAGCLFSQISLKRHLYVNVDIDFLTFEGHFWSLEQFQPKNWCARFDSVTSPLNFEYSPSIRHIPMSQNLAWATNYISGQHSKSGQQICK